METIKRPLDGVKVVELATFIAAPSCTRYLADLGAEVIKVESPAGDNLRYTAINEGRPTGDLENTCFDCDNANKKGICLNIKTPEGREVLEKLIAESDIFVTNVRHKSLVRDGLDYDTLKVKYPKLVMGYVTGYGENGPDKDLPGFDFTAFFARGGILGTLMDKDAVPMLTIPGFGDHPVGLYLANGILAALYRARETGKGDKVTVSLFHSAIWAIAIMLQGAQYGMDATRYPMSRKDIANPLTVVHKTKGGRWIQFAAPAYNLMYNRFVTALGREDLVDHPDYATAAACKAHTAQLVEILSAEFAKHTMDDIAAMFARADIAYDRVQHIKEVLDDPQALENMYIVPMANRDGTITKQPATPIRFATAGPACIEDIAPTMDRQAPLVGEHSAEILKEHGYSDEEIQKFLDDKVIYIDKL